MSRTYRRKDYEEVKQNSWDRMGQKKFGKGNCGVDYAYTKSGGLSPIYRELTKEEKKRNFLRYHTDKGKRCGMGRPPRWFLNLRERTLRQDNKHELYKFMQDQDYEPMCTEEKQWCWWYWW